MRHRLKDKKLGRSQAHRKALMSALVNALIEQRRIRTTLQKAKEARREAERMVTLAKKGTLAARRRVASKLRRPKNVGVLFDQLVPAMKDRKGGYTRIIKLDRRRSDGAERVFLEWVDVAPVEKKKEEPAAAQPETKKT